MGIKLGLERTRALLRELGNPEQGKRGALVTGTNGKGSTCAFLAAILESAGHQVGTMPSPHLSSYTERIQVDGRPISEAAFADAVAGLLPALDAVAERLGPATEFEVLTALALRYLGPRTDRLAIEIGMGGRLDTTNVLNLGVAVITNVELDHTAHLGATREAIAAEKAAIIKPGNRAVTGAGDPGLGVVEAAAGDAGAELWRLGAELRLESRGLGWEGSELDLAGPGYEHRRLRIPLAGSFQAANAALAVAAAEALGDATPAAVRAGLARTRWPGRLEVRGELPRVVFDGAHNPAALRALAGELPRLLGTSRLVAVFAAMADKDLRGMLDVLRGLEPESVVFTAAASAGERGADPDLLAGGWPGQGEAIASAPAALERARELAGPGGTVLVCGSLYLVGELRSLVGELRGRVGPPP